jgi:outer membrane autotransporter protein
VPDVPIIEHLQDVRRPSAVAVTYAAPENDGKTVLDGKTILSEDGKEILYLSKNVDKRWSSFVAGTGVFTSRGSDFTTGAVTLGADYRVADNFIVGAAIGYADTYVPLQAGGSFTVNSGLISLYATGYSKGFYVDGIVGLGYHSYDTQRANTGGFARGETDGASIHTYLGGGYDCHIGAFTIGAVASVRYTDVTVDGFNEHGSAAPMRVPSGSLDALQSALGLKVAYSWNVGGAIVTPMVRAQWGHEYLDTRGTINPRDPFIPEGTNIGADSLLLDAGASVRFLPTVSVFGFYSGDIGRENYTSHSVNGGISISF